MAGSRGSTGAPLADARADAPGRRDRGVRGALTGTWGGRLIIGGAAIKLAVLLLSMLFALGRPLNAIDTLASLIVAAGGAYFLARALSAASARLLWRVRRKLIISYIFIGFIPAILIVAFFTLGSLLLFSNFSSYLVQTRLVELGERARAVAEATALEIRLANGRDVRGILRRRQQALARETPSASLALIPMSAPCGDADGRRAAARTDRDTVTAAGPWAHMDPPRDVPAWIGCEGFAGVVAYLTGGAAPGANGPGGDVNVLVRAVSLPLETPGPAVVVDVPVDAAVRSRLRADTSVEITGVQLMTGGDRLPRGRPIPASTAADAVPAGSLPQPAVSFLEHRDWTTGATGTLQTTMQLSIGQIYGRISAAQGSVGGRSLGQWFVIGLLVVGALFLFIQFVAVVMGLALARSITGSVHELFTGTVKVQQGDFTHRIGATANDQLGALAESFNSMTASIENLLLDAAEKKRLEEELRIAHEIQMSLLPQAPTSLAGLSIAALCVPAREVGGDYYDFLPLDGHRLGVLIADVAGKGTSAALYMAELKGLMLSLSRTYASPRELLIMANRLIAEHLDARSFITMTYAVIDLRARTMTYARAGHTPLLYLAAGAGAASSRIQLLAPDGLVLGLKVDDGVLFERLLVEQTLTLGTGDVCLLYTDGMTEAMDAQDDCFGEQRLSRIVEEHAHLPCEELRERLLREVAAFVGGAPQHDDMTMILIKVDDLPAPAAGDVRSSSAGAELAQAVRR